MSDAIKPILARLAAGQVLSAEEAEAFFAACLRGEPTPAQVASAITALKLRGETVEEIAACARAMRAAADPLAHPFEVVDCCGTGGDGAHTLNISTAVAFVAAGAGVKVAKHGGRAASSRSGAADVLQALGVQIEASPDRSRRALAEANVCFLFAQSYHRAMRHVAGVRSELGFRSLFNLLGPLANPAGAQRQLLGVFDPRWLEPLAAVLGQLGCQRAWVVHGQGLDELALSGPSEVAIWTGAAVERAIVDPQALGLSPAPLDAIRGGAAEDNAAALRALLAGERGAYRDIVCLNAAAVFVIAERVGDLAEGLELARDSVDSGRAQLALDRLAALSRNAAA